MSVAFVVVKDSIHFDMVTYCCCHRICGPWTNYLNLQLSWALWSPKTQGVRIRIDVGLGESNVLCANEYRSVPLFLTFRGETSRESITTSEGQQPVQYRMVLEANKDAPKLAILHYFSELGLSWLEPSGLCRAEQHMLELGTFFLSAPFYLLVYEFSFSFCR